MRVALSLGGRLLTKEGGVEPYLRYADALRELKRRGHQMVVVCGGGRIAREYIHKARELGAPPHLQDRLGVLATHVNALLLIAALGDDAHPRVLRRADEVRRYLEGRILVGGGHLPGSSTDYRTVLFARAMKADVIVNATEYGGIFDRDPSKYHDARKYEYLTFEELEGIIKDRFQQAPGDYGLFDLKATRLARRLGIPVVFIDGSDPSEIIRAVEGGHNGTVVRCWKS